MDEPVLSRLRRWTPERRALAESLVVRPFMLVALLLLLWGHVSLVAIFARLATHGFADVLFALFEAPHDRTAALLNATLALVALAFWLVVGMGFVERRWAHREPKDR